MWRRENVKEESRLPESFPILRLAERSVIGSRSRVATPTTRLESREPYEVEILGNRKKAQTTMSDADLYAIGRAQQCKFFMLVEI